MNAVHCAFPNARIGLFRSVESRTNDASWERATSMHPLFPQRLLFFHCGEGRGFMPAYCLLVA